MFGLIDCNSFYCSCQKAFDPRLKHRPVVVLSNNDGCAIARTKEAKDLGIKMGDAWHLIRNMRKLEHVAWFSSNYPLYADMSRRVYEVLLDYVPRVEAYSIDEMFLDLSGFHEDLSVVCEQIRTAVDQITKIPTCVGWGPTKSIAKLANYIAKDRPELEGLCDLSASNVRERYYRNLSVSEVWGIGRRLAPRLHDSGIRTIQNFVDADEAFIRKIMSVTGVRLQAELRGENCLPLSEAPGQRKGMVCSRSFGCMVTDYTSMREAICTFTSRAAEKLRAEDLECGHLTVFIQTSSHRRQDEWYAPQVSLSFPPTNSTFSLVKHATRLLDAIWKDGFRYMKAGVGLNDLAPSNRQHSLFVQEDEQKSRASDVMDVINRKFGQGTLNLLGAGIQKKWAPRQNMLSPRYTTDINEIMVATTF
ncbi:SOS (error prone) mutagenesis protein UmuC [Acetobacter pasteurianus NBRC 3280]|uniref:DNA-directed DNA polymerase n=1 Tax=Acetobacter pasteurianus NBRC 3278 TaxID=1226660 RepID=A0A401X771_ACEPA|nr:Y-family DNA polymerase [Acetobacter pasteurianus]GCD60212.1 SOS (error prone) mutagenesis protein UmuC [Acetobacter pasteurianus NBRC 3277]GCD63785.1 SOS (error prone) mutagenesis protein UmuC [Acetobacter pasteurianus NBRC 3278]GCD70221.1 SOS (error prone) mutagenesis protein UmuC [Acetobacter pasteurianus NBRC 3280]